MWLSEFGCLTKNESGIIPDQLDWMETYSGIDRYAWFSAGPNQHNNYGNLFSGLPDQTSFGLSVLGVDYAQYPHTPSGLPCPRGNVGNLDCTASGKIDASDLDILLGVWGSPAPTTAPDFSSANLDNQNGIDASDLDILLSNWGIGS